VNLHIDSINSGRYSLRAAAKSAAGIGVPDMTTAHNRANAVFLCAKRCHIRIMVGRAGASKDAPGSVVTGYANPARLTTLEIGVSGGGLQKPTTEAAIMATVPTLSQPEIILVNGRAVTTSLAVAAYFSKRHDDVLKKINYLECSPEFTARNFAASDYTDATGRKLPCNEITRDGFAFLAMGFTGKRAAIFKENYIEAFNRMEAQSGTPAVSCRSRVVLTLENGVVVSSREIATGEHICTVETFLEIAERQGYLIIHADDLKSLSLGRKKRGDA